MEITEVTQQTSLIPFEERKMAHREPLGRRFSFCRFGSGVCRNSQDRRTRPERQGSRGGSVDSFRPPQEAQAASWGLQSGDPAAGAPRSADFRNRRPLDLGLEDGRAAETQIPFCEHYCGIDGAPSRSCPVVGTRTEVAARADKPAAVFIRVVGSETDGDRTLITLRALEAVEHTAG